MTDVSHLPGPLLDAWEWQQRGSCRATDTELFFHPDGERGSTRSGREAAAKAVCAGCPVLATCRAHALASREPFGIWGGLSEHDREQILGVPLAPAV
jgi:WhiB family redox-sensing transcriptional regulator